MLLDIVRFFVRPSAWILFLVGAGLIMGGAIAGRLPVLFFGNAEAILGVVALWCLGE